MSIPPTPTPAAPPGQGGDPSMEDILASIRRILNEEEAPAAPAPQPPPHEEDVLVLDPSMRVDTPALSPPAAAAAPPAQAEGASGGQAAIDALFDSAPSPAPNDASNDAQDRAMPEFAPPPAAAMPSDAAAHGGGLLAPESAAAAAAAVGSLVRELSVERGALVYSGGPTLEDLVRAELRPLLKSWLDQHLPPLVERLVRTEIERVIGRAVP
ncbi:MAG: DUF2497 domain-containing protein [Rhodospirillales bacterium]|nr:DUF2497 domain-containing protein [Rhodospirillales bacterium]